MSKEQYIEFPEEYTRRELNARYREIPLKDTTSRLLRKYFNAMANLYGIIPLHKAKEIVFSLSPKLVTEDEFLAFAEISRHECEDYYILGGDELYTDVRHTKPLDRQIIDVTLIGESIDLSWRRSAASRTNLTMCLTRNICWNTTIPSTARTLRKRLRSAVLWKSGLV